MAKLSIKKTIRIKKFTLESLKIRCQKPADLVNCRIIEAIDKEIITGEIHQELPVKNGEILPVPESDILKIAVIERHRKTGNIGLGFVKNFGIKNGALATTVAHDSHNIIAVGSSDNQIYLAIKKLIEINGGYTVVKNNKVIATLSLPIAGLMSDQPWKKTVYELEKINFAVHRQLKTSLTNPFMTLSFLALPVIPKLKITDKGLFDVDQFKFVDIMIL